MGANEYSPHRTQWSFDQWLAYCPNMEYRVVQSDNLPPGIPSSLSAKFNCAIVVSSGNANNHTFVVQGYRVDGDEIDEHQYIVTYDHPAQQVYAGFIHHGNYPERSTPIPKEMLDSIFQSGVSVNVRFDRKPPSEAGALSDLISAGLICGFENSVSDQRQVISEMPKNWEF